MDHHGKKKSHFKNLYRTPCTMYMFMLKNQAQSNKLLILHYKKKKPKK